MTRQIAGADASGNALNTDATCPSLTASGRCAVYSVRPMICRVWGLVREMACPWGCVPDRWLSGREVQRLLASVADGRVEGPGRDFIAAMNADPGLRDKVHEVLGNPFGEPGDRKFR